MTGCGGGVGGAGWGGGVGIQSNHSLCRQQHVFPRVQLVGVRVLPVQVLAHGFGGELRLADVTEVPRQVHRLTWRGDGGGGRGTGNLRTEQVKASRCGQINYTSEI